MTLSWAWAEERLRTALNDWVRRVYASEEAAYPAIATFTS